MFLSLCLLRVFLLITPVSIPLYFAPGIPQTHESDYFTLAYDLNNTQNTLYNLICSSVKQTYYCVCFYQSVQVL